MYVYQVICVFFATTIGSMTYLYAVHIPAHLSLSSYCTGDEGLPKCDPTLAQFKAQVDSYESVYSEVEKLSSCQVFDSWLRVDIMPFRAALLNTVKRWSLMFKEHLVNHVTNRCVHVWILCSC